MPDSTLDLAAQYGPLGLICLAMGWFILHIMRMHKTERDEWRSDSSSQHTDFKEALNNNTSVLHEIKALIYKKEK